MAVIICSGERHTGYDYNSYANADDVRVKHFATHEIRHEGCVLALSERNSYHDSDFIAEVWDPETNAVKTIVYGTTAYWTYHNTAEVDATPDVRAKAVAWAAERLAAAWLDKARRYIGIGIRVRSLTQRGKNAGIVGVVQWVGTNRMTGAKRYGIRIEGERSYRFLDAHQVERVHDITKEEEEEIRAKALERARFMYGQPRAGQRAGTYKADEIRRCRAQVAEMDAKAAEGSATEDPGSAAEGAAEAVQGSAAGSEAQGAETAAEGAAGGAEGGREVPAVQMPGSTPEELRARARAHERAAQESFERCDTDGSLTQWAHRLNAAEDALQAQILAQGGRYRFPALFDLDGELVPAKLIDGRYGLVWGILESEDPRSAIVEWFTPSRAKDPRVRRRNNARKGYYVGWVMARAKAEIVSGGRALAGAASARSAPVRIDGGFSRDVIIVDNGQDDGAEGA